MCGVGIEMWYGTGAVRNSHPSQKRAPASSSLGAVDRLGGTGAHSWVFTHTYTHTHTHYQLHTQSASSLSIILIPTHLRTE